MKRARIRNATDRVGRRTGGKLTVEQKVLDCVRARGVELRNEQEMQS